MPKREVNWQPDIYDMAARRKGSDPSPPLPKASGRITDLQDRQAVTDESPRMPNASGRISDLPARREAAARAVAALDDYEDADLDAEDELLTDLDSDGGTPAMERQAATPAKSARRGDNSGLLGMLLGALVGAGLTLLVTPASGAQLRTRLQGGKAPAPTAPGYSGIREGVAQNMPNIMAVEQAAPPTEAEQL